MQFSDFDSRGYPTVDVRSGYGAWAASYEQSVEDAMDIALLDALTSVPWTEMHAAADLGCGTGRTGEWLRRHGVQSVDGVDLTPQMLKAAAAKNVYRRLVEADIAETGLPSGAYDLVSTSLVDEHLPDLRPLYGEAARLTRPGGRFVLVGYHPHFIMLSGMPTHYHEPTGEAVAIATHIHLLSEHVNTGIDAGWALVEMRERIIDDTWVTLKPQWERFRRHPISVALSWVRAGAEAPPATHEPPNSGPMQ